MSHFLTGDGRHSFASAGAEHAPSCATTPYRVPAGLHDHSFLLCWCLCVSLKLHGPHVFREGFLVGPAYLASSWQDVRAENKRKQRKPTGKVSLLVCAEFSEEGAETSCRITKPHLILGPALSSTCSRQLAESRGPRILSGVLSGPPPAPLLLPPSRLRHLPGDHPSSPLAGSPCLPSGPGSISLKPHSGCSLSWIIPVPKPFTGTQSPSQGACRWCSIHGGEGTGYYYPCSGQLSSPAPTTLLALSWIPITPRGMMADCPRQPP